MKFLLPILLPLSVFASNILSYNIYDRTDRVDVMITFDTPYSGTIRQMLNDSKIIIKLEDAKIESSKVRQLSTNFLHSISITPMSQYTQIVAAVPSSVHLVASKTSDSYGLRLRFTKSMPKKEVQKEQSSSSKTLSSLPTKKSEDLSQSYYIVIAILFMGIIILLVFKRKLNQKEDLKSWLFQNNATKKENSKSQLGLNGLNEISIKFQKDINSSNSVIMIDFQEQSYLVLMGSNNNILLDKFSDNKPTTQEDFESIISSKSQELDEFLKVGNSNNKSSEPLQAYKERAASLMYADEN